MKLILIGIVSVLVSVGIYLYTDNRVDWFSTDKTTAKMTRSSFAATDLKIVNTWTLPDVLLEISGVVHLDDRHFACVQDEEGIVFIYDKVDSKIIRQVSFAGPGDYEGIALVGKSIFVVRSDGRIFEVPDITGNESKAKEYSTSLSEANNVEGLCYDKANNRLLIAVKDTDPNGSDAKGVYAFDLATRQFNEKPVFLIRHNDKVFAGIQTKSSKSVINPSAIAIHPQTSDVYVVDGPNARLLVMDKNGSTKSLHDLGKGDFPKAEGITFDEKGLMYISSEGKKKKSGRIMEVVKSN